MEIGKIYFDMDGTLADFDRGVKELVGMDPVPQNNARPEGYDDALWAGIKKADHFYLNLKPMDGAIDLFMHIYQSYGNKCEILTGVPKEKRGITEAPEDKRIWVQKYLPAGIVVNTIHREDKKNFCGGRSDILIDDFQENITAWEAYGGTGILYTTPENVLNAFRRMESL